MRSVVNVSDEVRFFPQHFKKMGYFTACNKRDYNIPDQENTWDMQFWGKFEDDVLTKFEKDEPFFIMYNNHMTHESRLHDYDKPIKEHRKHFAKLDSIAIEKELERFDQIDFSKAPLPTYLPDLKDIRNDYNQYHKQMALMDADFKRVMDELEKKGVLENTIVIYCSDHGGVMARSKRFTYDSGLRIPLMIHVPEKYKHLTDLSGSIDTPVSLVDIAPTVLKLAGVDAEHYSGSDILNASSLEQKSFAYGFRGRMDEAYDMSRTLVNKKYRYVRNYYPHRPAGQHINYLWKAKNVQALDQARKEGVLNEVQQMYFESRPGEELYDTDSDLDNIENLAEDKAYQEILEGFRAQKDSLLKARKDAGFIPESMLWEAQNVDGTNYLDFLATQPYEEIVAAAEKATLKPDIKDIIMMGAHENQVVQFGLPKQHWCL